MSALLEPGARTAVRSLAGMAAPLPRGGATATPTADPVETERARLLREIERLGKALDDAGAEAQAAILDARAEGRSEGLADAEAREEDRVAALRDGIGEAAGAFATRLDLLDALAPQLVRTALGKLFDAPERWCEIAEAMLVRQLGTLRRSAVVAVQVSAMDFPDPAAIRALDGGAVRVETDSGLRAGACRIECKLGAIDLDVREQWQVLAGLLDEMGQAA
jgi:flagellar assembly protein FliH